MRTLLFGGRGDDLCAGYRHLRYDGLNPLAWLLFLGLLFLSLIAIPAIAYWYLNLDEVLAFWFAYILTRPIGASFADWAGRPANLRGVGLGQGG